MLGGSDKRLPLKLDREASKQGPKKKVYRRNHTSSSVHRSMLWQICIDYHVLPDPRTLTITEIVFWYDGLREVLRERTKPQRK